LAIDKASISKTSKKAFNCWFAFILLRCSATTSTTELLPDFIEA